MSVGRKLRRLAERVRGLLTDTGVESSLNADEDGHR